MICSAPATEVPPNFITTMSDAVLGMNGLRIVAAGLAYSARAAAEVAEHRLFGHPDQAEAAVGAHVAAPHPHVRAVRADDLDDRADVADLAVVAVVVLDRLHLLGHDPAHLALVKRHLTPFADLEHGALTICDAITLADISIDISLSHGALSPTAYVILGMVSSEPRSGYEIKALVDNSTRFFWAASYGQIYPELKRLAEAGLIERRRRPQGEPQADRLRITADGEEELRAWLRQPPETFEMRDEGLLKLFFADALPREEAVEILRAMRAAPARRLRAAAGDRAEATARRRTRFPLIVLRGGIEFNEWFADWCERMEAQLLESARREKEQLMFDALARLADGNARRDRLCRDRLLPPRRRARRLGRRPPRPLRRRRPGDRERAGDGAAARTPACGCRR